MKAAIRPTIKVWGVGLDCSVGGSGARTVGGPVGGTGRLPLWVGEAVEDVEGIIACDTLRRDMVEETDNRIVVQKRIDGMLFNFSKSNGLWL
jgi:hypothetical protein